MLNENKQSNLKYTPLANLAAPPQKTQIKEKQGTVVCEEKCHEIPLDSACFDMLLHQILSFLSWWRESKVML
jgi:hypothetical protein